MPTLPYTRVVNVTLTRQDAFPTRRGFGTPLIVSEIASDVTNLVTVGGAPKAYGSIEEVAADWGAATEAYKSANRMFGQNPRPVQIKIGAIGEMADAAAIVTAMNTLSGLDDEWYFLNPVAGPSWHDLPPIEIGFAQWVEAKNKQAFIESNVAATETAGGAANSSIARDVQAAGYNRTSVYYHPTAGSYLGAAAAAYMATRDFDQVNSAYTLKFKEFTGITVVNKGSAIVQAITGFVPALGLSAAAGYYANTYVDIGGRDFITEGTNGNGGFVDEVHFQDWIIARTQEEVLALFTNNARIPYTDKGMDQIVQAVQNVLSRALSAGNIAPYTDTNGNIRNWNISVPRVSTVAASQRRQRIAPAVASDFRYAGAVHYSTVNYTMQF